MNIIWCDLRYFSGHTILDILSKKKLFHNNLSPNRRGYLQVFFISSSDTWDRKSFARALIYCCTEAFVTNWKIRTPRLLYVPFSFLLFIFSEPFFIELFPFPRSNWKTRIKREIKRKNARQSLIPKSTDMHIKIPVSLLASE